MVSCEQSKTSPQYLDTVDLDRSVMQQEFYSPLCKSGYLTPLQRKKLREKRSLDLSDSSESVDHGNLKKKKLPQISKTKKDNVSKGIKKKDNHHKKIPVSPQVQCTVAKIFNRTMDDCDNKEKKFFKTSPCSRLERANFTMPLVLRKNFTCFDRNAKVIPINRRQIFSMQESKLDCQNDDAAFCEPDHYVSPIIIKLVPSLPNCVNYNSSSDNLEKQLDSPHTQDSSSCGDFNAEKSSIPTAADTCFDFEWPDDIFLKRQENARSAEKAHIQKELNSAAQNQEIDELKVSSESDAPIKFYPIFNLSTKKKVQSFEETKRNKPAVKFMKDSSKGGEQMIIDAGQREIGSKICNTCNMLYTIGEEEDEKLHSSYHSMFLINLKFPGWKNENVIGV